MARPRRFLRSLVQAAALAAGVAFVRDRLIAHNFKRHGPEPLDPR